MKKWLLITAGIVIGLGLLIGSFSAGFLSQKYIFPESNQAPTQITKEPVAPTDDVVEELDEPQITESEPTDAPPEKEQVSNTGEIQIPEDLNDLFKPFWEAWDIVHEKYVDQPLDDVALKNGAINGMILSINNYTEIDQSFSISGKKYSQEAETPEELQELFSDFWSSWALAHSPDPNALMQGAIRGMLESLGDQHSSYMNPDDFTQANIRMDESYEGIGAFVDVNREYLTIISPMPGSPAEGAGLRPADEIIAIDGEDMTGIDGNLVVRKVLGPAGSKVVLTIRREGFTEPFDVEIVRAQITIPSVEYRMLDDNVAYIHLLNFGDNALSELQDAMDDLLDDDPVGLVFDLRNNGGGWLHMAVDVASEFLPSGSVVLHEDHGDGSRDTFKASRGGMAVDIPLIILINEGTASASEIVAGAIQDHNRAKLVGTTSFGKGSVQQFFSLENEQGAIRVTVARWLTPTEKQIHQKGLEPNVAIGVISQAALDAGFDISSLGLPSEDIIILTEEDIQVGYDPQLEKAIEVLLEE